MSRYLAGDCLHYKSKYLERIEKMIHSLEKNYADMDFENAREKDDMHEELLRAGKTLAAARDTLSSMTFE